jgi:hypothetical protein
MGENIFRVFLADLLTVRVVCSCGAAIEVPLDKLGRLDRGNCSCCTKSFAQDMGGDFVRDRFARLQDAIHGFTNSGITIRLDFPVRLDSAQIKP